MALRLLEVILPAEKSDALKKLVEEDLAEGDYHGLWREELEDGRDLLRVLLNVEDTEALMDSVQKRFGDTEGFRLMLLPVEASLPRPEEKEESGAETGEPVEKKNKVQRISREELYADISQTVDFSMTYLVLVALAATVAAAGLIKNSVAVIIGAMVIAPLLGPNVALALATTLGDTSLAWRAIRINVIFVGTCFFLAILVGLILPVDPQVPEIHSRTYAGLGDIVLALASGGAGAISFTMGTPTALVGVMVAVALVPPLVASGMLLGSGHWEQATGALLLTLTNVICINLSAVLTFLIQGIRPGTWWEAERAKKATRVSLGLLLGLLVLLAAVILLWKRN